MQNEWYEYDEESDVLEIYFDERRPAWTIELTPNIMVSIDRTAQRPVQLTLLDYVDLVRLTDDGPQSFPIRFGPHCICFWSLGRKLVSTNRLRWIPTFHSRWCHLRHGAGTCRIFPGIPDPGAFR